MSTRHGECEKMGFELERPKPIVAFDSNDLSILI